MRCHHQARTSNGRISRTHLLACGVFVATLLPVVSGADSVTLPNTFTNGEVADADEVNANFDEVRNSVDDNDARVQTLEAIPDQACPAGQAVTGINAAGALVCAVVPPTPHTFVATSMTGSGDWYASCPSGMSIVRGFIRLADDCSVPISGAAQCYGLEPVIGNTWPSGSEVAIFTDFDFAQCGIQSGTPTLVGLECVAECE